MLKLSVRKPRAAGYWYPNERSECKFSDNPVSSCVISPHAGFEYSGNVSLEAVSYVKKKRIWIFGTSHREAIDNGISVYFGDYNSSTGKTKFPEKPPKILEKYFSERGHRTEEHSIENVLYCLNHFVSEVRAFCIYVQTEDENTFEKTSDDIASIWQRDDSIIVSTDWNHFVSTNIIDSLMEDAAEMLKKGEIKKLYDYCGRGKLEACGIDGVYMAYKVLFKVNENTKFNILKITDSSKSRQGKRNILGDTCVGYIGARN